MRALYLPDWYTSQELTGISFVSAALGLFAALQRLDPPEFATFCLPRSKTTYHWEDAVFEKPWLDPRMVAQDTWYVHQWPAHEPQWLDVLLPKRAKAPLADYVLTARYMHGAQVASAFYSNQNKWSWTPELPVLSWLPEIAEPPVLRSNYWQILAGAQAGALVTMNENDREDWLEVFETMVHHDAFERLKERIVVVHTSADFAGVDARYAKYEKARKKRRTDGEDVVVMSAGTFETTRNLPMLVAALEQLRADDVPVIGKFLGPAPGLQGQSQPAPESPAVTSERGVDHEQYVSRIGEADLFWAGFEHTATALSLNEAIRGGMLPIWLRRPWVGIRMLDGYPLIAETDDELATVLRFAVENIDALRREWVPKYRAFIDAWGPAQVADRWRQMTETVLAGPKARNLLGARGLKPAFDLLPEALETAGLTEVTDPKQLYEAFTRVTRSGSGLTHLSPTMLRWMLMALGWQDRCDRPGLSMVKEAA